MTDTNKRPPGEHITFPEIEWPEHASHDIHLRQDSVTLTPRSTGAKLTVTVRDPLPLPIGMIEPEPAGWSPWLFWALVLLSFGCVLAKAAGWL